MGQCFGLLKGSHERSLNENAHQDRKFVSPDALEASIFSERGVPPSKVNGHPSKADVGNFTLTADVGTLDKLSLNDAHNVDRMPSPAQVLNGSKPQKGDSQTLMRRCFPPVGLLLVLETNADDLALAQRQTLLEQIREDVAMAVTAARDRIRVVGFEKGRGGAQINILADLGNGDTRSPMQLACDLVEQSRNGDSKLRSAPTTATCTDAVIQEAPFPFPADKTKAGVAASSGKKAGKKATNSGTPGGNESLGDRTATDEELAAANAASPGVTNGARGAEEAPAKGRPAEDTQGKSGDKAANGKSDAAKPRKKADVDVREVLEEAGRRLQTWVDSPQGLLLRDED